MEKSLCFICEKHKGLKNLCGFDDEELNLHDTINEIFKIKFEENQISSKFKVCNGNAQVFIKKISQY